jgi:uncharacterized hydrophobic protein (TIGR00341 family)
VTLKVVEVITDAGYADTVAGIAAQQEILDFWYGPEGDDGRRSIRLLVAPEKRQAVMDALQSLLSGSERTRVVILPVEAVWPLPKEASDETSGTSVQTTREELYSQVEHGARLDSTYLLLVFLSTIVAAIGLIQDNVAVVIGAMVIAPLLGPNIALALGAALGDSELMWRALRTAVAGLGLAFALSFAIGYLWLGPLASNELLARTDVGVDGVALALASGAAAVLSLTTGLSSVLVGVMVAVALLPPTATTGLMLGGGHGAEALGAFLLLAVNVVCVNLAAKVVLLVRGVRPRTWLEKVKARQSMTAYMLIWVVSLLILLGAIYVRHQVIA